MALSSAPTLMGTTFSLRLTTFLLDEVNLPQQPTVAAKLEDIEENERAEEQMAAITDSAEFGALAICTVAQDELLVAQSQIHEEALREHALAITNEPGNVSPAHSAASSALSDKAPLSLTNMLSGVKDKF